MVENMVIMAQKEEITVENIPYELRQQTDPVSPPLLAGNATLSESKNRSSWKPWKNITETAPKPQKLWESEDEL